MTVTQSLKSIGFVVDQEGRPTAAVPSAVGVPCAHPLTLGLDDSPAWPPAFRPGAAGGLRM
jgi:hypothetical protein